MAPANSSFPVFGEHGQQVDILQPTEASSNVSFANAEPSSLPRHGGEEQRRAEEKFRVIVGALNPTLLRAMDQREAKQAAVQEWQERTNALAAAADSAKTRWQCTPPDEAGLRSERQQAWSAATEQLRECREELLASREEYERACMYLATLHVDGGSR